MAIFSIKLHLKKHIFYSIFLVLLAIAFGSCSTKKNTWASRTFQATNTRFNVYFNGYISYNEGLNNILKTNKEDYSTIIPMYPISTHANATGAKSDMDRTIEKCRKAIKLHSIKAKPKKNYKKMNSLEYKLFYNQEEFNPALSEAWLLLAKSEFHKGDFLGSAGTFSYIARHYSIDKNMVAVCKLWIVRAYGEMGWIYEAEQVLSKLNQDDLKHSNSGLFASVNADLLLKKKMYKEAVPFLELAAKSESNKPMRQRFQYILAQLYQKTGDTRAALGMYSNVIKQNPPYEMDFNARINRAQINSENVSKVRRELQSMLKNKNNKEYRDQLYYAIGNTYLNHGDTAQAIKNYILSADTSSRKGIDKAITLTKLGDLYYLKRKYALAQPCYEDASKILTIEHSDFAHVSKRAETLGELVSQNDIVLLQDSLQKLSKLSEKEKLIVINNIIAKLKESEKRAADQVLKENEVRTRGMMNEDEFATPPIGMSSIGGWYFYNPDIMRSGSTEFKRKWGNRKLEDNWRRTNKSSALFADENLANAIAKDSVAKDSSGVSKKSEEISDTKTPEFYLRQIPTTPDQLEKSDNETATALFTMGEIYKEKIEDYPMGISTFNDFITRFGKNTRIPDAYFNLYMIQTKLENNAEAELYRTKLITEFPDTKYSKILKLPDYKMQLKRMYAEQDSIYSLAYQAYKKSDFETVINHTDYVQKNFPLSALLPKFIFLNALSIGKKDTPEKFNVALTNLVTQYPTSDVSAMAKDILALMSQGKESKTGTTSGSLLTRREEKPQEEIEDIKEAKFSAEKQTRHRLMLVSSVSKENLHILQYNVASFNFSRFMIKDFDLVINRLDTIQNAVSVTGFESYDDASWYLNSSNSDTTLLKLYDEFKIRKIIISEENFGLLKNTFTLGDYLTFLAKPIEAGKTVATQVKTTERVAQTTTAAKKTEKPTAKNNPENKKNTSVVETKIAKVDTVISKEKTETQETVEKLDQKKTISADTISKNSTKTMAVSQPAVAVQPKTDDVPLYKGLFAYKANDAHYIALYVLSGTINYEKVKTAFESFNNQNYSAMSLKLKLEKINNLQIILIGSLPNAAAAKSYLLRIVKEKSLFEGLKGVNYRNLLGTQKNLNVVVEKNALNTYFDFMQEYYLK